MPFKIEMPSMKIKDQIKSHLDAILTGIEEIFRANRITIEYPRERRKYPDNFRGMLAYDPTGCISCFQCAFICPATAIQMKLAPNGKYYACINYAKCIFCHFCVDSCPRGAFKATKIHDVAFKDMKDMLVTTDMMVDKPEIPIEAESVVEFVEKDNRIKIKRGHVVYLKADPEKGDLVLVKHPVEE
jgi:NADH-quinone oxidoreductase subunit I